MNVQYSAYSATCDFQDPDSHSVFPSRASVKPFFALGLLHRLQEGVGGSCPPSRTLRANALGPCCSFAIQSNFDGFAHHHPKQEGGLSGTGKEEVGSEERQDGKPTHCVGGQPGPSLPTPVGNAEIPDICFHAKMGQNINIFQFC